MDWIGESLGGRSHKEQPMECKRVDLVVAESPLLVDIPGIAASAGYYLFGLMVDEPP